MCVCVCVSVLVIVLAGGVLLQEGVGCVIVQIVSDVDKGKWLREINECKKEKKTDMQSKFGKLFRKVELLIEEDTQTVSRTIKRNEIYIKVKWKKKILEPFYQCCFWRYENVIFFLNFFFDLTVFYSNDDTKVSNQITGLLPSVLFYIQYLRKFNL